MIDQLLTLNDLKLVLVGAFGTLLAGLITYFVRRWLTAKPNLLWAHQTYDMIVPLKNDTFATAEYHEITIENVGRTEARDILVVIPKLLSKFTLRKWNRNFIYLSNRDSTRIADFNVTEENGITKIRVPFVEGRTTAKVSYCTNVWSTGYPESVSFNGGIAIRRYLRPAYFRMWDVIRPLAIRLAFLAIAVGLTYLISLVVPRK